MSAEDRCTMSVMLTSRNARASTRFYRDRLGFEMKESWPNAEDPKWANLVLDGQSIMVGAAMAPDEVGQMCAGAEPGEIDYWRKTAEEFQAHKAGVGIQVYVMVPDVDAYHATIKDRGVETSTEPKTQFYGIRDFAVDDPDGYRLVFFSPVTMTSCQSCGMPLSDAAPGQMYCPHCTNEKGQLLPYETVLEGTTVGYFMGMQKMERAPAEKAAREHLKKMPAWAGR